MLYLCYQIEEDVSCARMKVYSTKQINACYIITRGKSYVTDTSMPLDSNPSFRTPQYPTGKPAAVKDLRGNPFLDPEPGIPQ